MNAVPPNKRLQRTNASANPEAALRAGAASWRSPLKRQSLDARLRISDLQILTNLSCKHVRGGSA